MPASYRIRICVSSGVNEFADNTLQPDTPRVCSRRALTG